jgi:4-aminobutyrate aminotransferase
VTTLLTIRPSSTGTVATQETTDTERILAKRDRYVARGIAASKLVVARAEGARVWDVDGRSYVDFAGGIACQNTGHGFPPVVAAIHGQADQYLHQCFMVGVYEPYVEVCELLAGLSPCGAGDQRSILVSSGAEAIENAVKIARAATGRPAVIVFENAFHGRTLLTMTMTAKLVYKKGFGPFAPEVYRSAGPYPYRGVSSDAALEALEDLFRSDVDPESVACAVLEPVQGEGGFIPMPADFPARLRELLSEHGILYVDDEVQSGVGRTGPVWAIEHYGVEPDIVVSGKSLGGGLPLAGVTGKAEVMDAVHPGGLGGTFGGNPLSCAAALAVLDEVATPEFRARADAIGERFGSALDAIAAKVPAVGEVRGLGPMLAVELVTDRETKQPDAELAKRTIELARERGLVLLGCGMYGNVLRLLPPLIDARGEIEEGLAILEGALVDASAGAS